MSLVSRIATGKAMPTWCATALMGWFLAASPSLQGAGPDYGKGFDLLFELGLPDVSGWQYVELEGESNQYDPFSSDGRNGPDGGILKKVLSRGWLEKQSPESKWQQLMVDGWQMQGVTDDQSAWMEMQAAGVRWSGQRPGKKAVDEQADARDFVKGLQLMIADEEVKRTLLYSSDRVITLFFRAAHYHRRGYKEEAAAAAQSLFSIMPRKERLVDLAVEKLTETRLQQALRQHAATDDWKGLEAALTGLLKTYNRGWPQRPLVERLHQLVQQRLTVPIAPVIPGAGLTDEQQTWWREVADGKKVPPNETEEKSDADTGFDESVNISQLAQIWLSTALIQADPEGVDKWQEQLKSAPPWMQALFEKGKNWDWIVVFAAGLGDNTLVTSKSSTFLESGSGESFDFESEILELDEEQTEELWRNMIRPPTRGDLARGFLDSVLPRNDEGGEELPEEITELRTLAVETAKNLRGKTPLQVAHYYLKGGTSAQKSMAMQAIIRSGDAGDLKMVEELVLAQPSRSFEQAGHLVSRQKAESKPFLDKFRKALVEEYAQRNSGSPSEEKEALPDYFNEQLNALEALASGRGVEDILEEFVAGKINSDALARRLNPHLRSKADSQTAADKLLAATARIPKGEGKRKWELLGISMNFLQGFTEERKQVLQKLLQKDGDAPVPSDNGETQPLSHYIYWTADYLANGDTLQALRNQLQGIDADELWPLWVARGKATLEGSPLPEDPSGDQVSETRRKEMLGELDQRLDKGWPEYVKALSINEKIALNDELKKAEFKPAWLATAQRITRLDVEPESLATHDAVKACANQRLTAELLIKLGEAIRSQLPALSAEGVRCYISPLPFYQGMRLQMWTEKAEGSDRRSMVPAVHQWIKQSQDGEEAPTIKAYAWMRWMADARQAAAINWSQGKETSWTAWTATDHEQLGRPPIYGNLVTEADLANALKERLQNWDPSKDTFWWDAGAVKAPVPAEAAPKKP